MSVKAKRIKPGPPGLTIQKLFSIKEEVLHKLKEINQRIHDAILNEHRKLDFIESSTAELTLRENEVLPLLRLGLRNKEIATVVNLSERTVKFHVSNIIHKVGARNRIQLVRKTQ